MVIAKMIYFMILAFGAATGSSGEEILYVFIIGGLGALGISAGLHDAIGKGLVAQAAKE